MGPYMEWAWLGIALLPLTVFFLWKAFDFDCDWSGFAIFLALALLVGVVGLASFGGINAMSNHACEVAGERANIATDYDAWSGCFYRVNGEWVPEERWLDIREDGD